MGHKGIIYVYIYMDFIPGIPTKHQQGTAAAGAEGPPIVLSH